MVVRKLCLPEINWSFQEEACATDLVKETLQRARAGSVQEALGFATAALGFDSFVFGIVANDPQARCGIAHLRHDQPGRSLDPPL